MRYFLKITILVLPLAFSAVWNTLYCQQQASATIAILSNKLSDAKNDTNKVIILDSLALEYENSDPEKGKHYSEQALELATNLNWKKGIAESYHMLGYSYHSMSDYAKAVDHLFKSLKVYSELGDKQGEMKLLTRLGDAYNRLSTPQKAIDYYSQALKIAEQQKNIEYTTKNLRGIGEMHQELHEYSKGQEYLLQALKIDEEQNDKDLIGGDLMDLGNMYQGMHNYQLALAYDFRALGYVKQANDKYGAAIVLGNIGETYVLIAKDTNNEISADSLVPATKKETLNKALYYLGQSIVLCKETGFRDGLQYFTKLLSETLEMLGNYNEALKTYKQFTALKDSVFSTQNIQRIAEIEGQQKIEIKNKELQIAKLKSNFLVGGIVLLLLVAFVIYHNYQLLSKEKKKVEATTKELEKTNEALNTTLVNLRETQQQLIQAEKLKENEIIRSRISQDIHDDISSELNKISWISELAKAKLKKDNLAELPTLLDKVTETSQETVNKLGEIIWTVNPKNDSLASLLSYMRTHVGKFLADTSFRYAIHFPDNELDVSINPELKRNLFLVLKEALNNVVKYSQASDIEVSFRLEGVNYFLSIADNGLGMNENVIQGGGNGLGNMRRRMEAVRGKLQITSAAGKGTTILAAGTLT